MIRSGYRTCGTRAGAGRSDRREACACADGPHTATAARAHLEREQQQERLDAVEAAVDKVAHEEVVGVRHVAADLEELLQVVELAVDVATDLAGAWRSQPRGRARCEPWQPHTPL